ncbi:MAG: hypothetical protein R3B39_00915 [Candidatus Paceibacterota bacterium]
MKKLLVLFTFALCLWVNETSAQSSCPAEEDVPFLDVQSIQDGGVVKGVIIKYNGFLSSVQEVRIQTKSCEDIVLTNIKMKRNSAGEKAVFIPGNKFTSGENNSVLYEGHDILRVTFVCDDLKASAM